MRRNTQIPRSFFLLYHHCEQESLNYTRIGSCRFCWNSNQELPNYPAKGVSFITSYGERANFYMTNTFLKDVWQLFVGILTKSGVSIRICWHIGDVLGASFWTGKKKRRAIQKILVLDCWSLFRGSFFGASPAIWIIEPWVHLKEFVMQSCLFN